MIFKNHTTKKDKDDIHQPALRFKKSPSIFTDVHGLGLVAPDTPLSTCCSTQDATSNSTGGTGQSQTYRPLIKTESRWCSDTVDGWNPAPPRMMIIPLFIGFHTSQGGAGFLPSTVSSKNSCPTHVQTFPSKGLVDHPISRNKDGCIP